MKINALIADPSDSVVTLTAAVRKGDTVAYYCGADVLSLTAKQDIPVYHKIAVRPVEKGRPVLKYGEIIGIARCGISPGEHVHTHNLSSDGR